MSKRLRRSKSAFNTRNSDTFTANATLNTDAILTASMGSTLDDQVQLDRLKIAHELTSTNANPEFVNAVPDLNRQHGSNPISPDCTSANFDENDCKQTAPRSYPRTNTASADDTELGTSTSGTLEMNPCSLHVTSLAEFSAANGIPPVGSIVEAQDYTKAWLLAQIIDLQLVDKKLKVSFAGWSQKFNEWVSSDSIRPVSNPTSSDVLSFCDKLEKLQCLSTTPKAKKAVRGASEGTKHRYEVEEILESRQVSCIFFRPYHSSSLYPKGTLSRVIMILR